MEKRTFDDFDGYAADYRAIHSENVSISGADSLYFARMKVDHICRFEQSENLSMLDLGCGDGATEFFIKQVKPSWAITGIDVSKKSIEVAVSRTLPGVDFLHYDGSHIPLADASVDIVFVAGVFHHIAFEFHQQLQQEIFRVLRPGGRLYFFEHNPWNPLTRYLVRTCVFDDNATLLYPRYAKELLRKAGLHVMDTDYIIFFPRKGILSRLIPLEKYLRHLPIGGQYCIRAVKS
jgi:SAM-dependent methyltransferase